jgi:aspartyl protease family protein
MRTFDIKLDNGPASTVKTGWNAARRALLGCALILLSHSVYGASSINLLALFGEKALLHIDGTQRLLQTGETSPEGVTLVSVDSEHAVVEVNGREEVLDLSFTALFPGSEAVPEDNPYQGPQKVSLWADASGFFYSNGMIDGFPVRFLVDTGATSIAVSSQLADRIGIDYADSQRGLANTAGGVTPMYRVSLDKVTVGGITLRNVDAGVVVGSFPREPLLGMSFLGQLDMVREGNRMDLKRRF